MRTTKIALVIAFCVFAALKLNAEKATHAADKPLLSLSAFAVDMAGPGGARTGRFEIVIERWSSEVERQRLRDTLIEKGSEGLLTTLRDLSPRVGFIRSGSSLGWDIHYAREEVSPVTGRRRIVFATDRPMSQWELMNRPRSSEYEFTLGEVRIGSDGSGEGKLVPAAKVSFNKETQVIEIENYATEPVRLTMVSAVPKDDNERLNRTEFP